MGSGEWSTDVYSTRSAYKASHGISTFDWSDRAFASGKLEAHASLDPKGLKMRESRDSEEHPESVPIAVIFDVTGSMLDIPVTLQKKLPGLLGLLLRKGYVEHPQILFGAVGDATCDSVPLQIGQFESDNRMDETIENLVLEGGGGGQLTESYELGMYTMARKVETDAWTKRGKKGYLFLIGDETAYPKVSRDEVRRLIGDGLEADIPLAAMVSELKERWEVFFLFPREASHGRDPHIREFWHKLFGQRLLIVEDISTVAETIALTIGMEEGTVDLGEGKGHLLETGLSKRAADSVALTLREVTGSGHLATLSGGVPVPAGAKAERIGKGAK